MPRDTARQIESSPNLVHVDVRRNSNGVVQMTTILSTTQTGITTANAGSVTTTATNLVAFSSATAKLTSAGSAATLKIKRDGATIASTTTGTTGGTITTSTSTTLTTPANAPLWSITATVTGGTAKLTSATVKREQRWSA